MNAISNYSQYSKENPMILKVYWMAPNDYTGWVKTEFRTLYHMKNGEIHNDNGHAVERTNGEKKWCIDGKLHRLYGPARECPNGEKYWYIRGIPYDKQGFDKHPEVLQYQQQHNPEKPVPTTELSYEKERKKFLGIFNY